MMPLKTPAVVFVLVLLVSCKPDLEFSIEGSVNVDGADGWVYLHKLWTEVPSKDSVLLENGKFLFTGEIHGPDLYALSIPSQSKEVCTFILEADEISVLFDCKDPYNDGTKVSGGPMNEEFNREQKFQEESYYNEVKRLFAERKPGDEEQKRIFYDKVKDLQKANSSYVSSYIQDHALSPVSMYLMVWWYYQKPLLDLDEVLYVFSPKLRNTASYREFESDHNSLHP